MITTINQELINNKKMLNEKFVNIIFGKSNIKVNSSININDLKKWKNEFLSINKLNPFKTLE